MDQAGWNSFMDSVGHWFPLFVGALVIFTVGWIIAALVEKGVKNLLASLRVNERIYASHGGDMIQRFLPNIENELGSLAFWIVIIGAVSLAVSVLGIPALTSFIGAIYAYLPNVIAALAIFLVATAITAALTRMVSRVMGDTPTGKLVEAIIPFLVLGIAAFMILDQLKIAPSIITITYAAIMGSAALGLALSFGLGGREVASKILEAAYDRTQHPQVKKDIETARSRAKEEVRKVKQER